MFSAGGRYRYAVPAILARTWPILRGESETWVVGSDLRDQTALRLGPSPTARRSDYTTFQAKIRKAVTTEVITTIIDKEPGNQNTGRPCQGSSLYNVYQLCEPIS